MKKYLFVEIVTRWNFEKISYENMTTCGWHIKCNLTESIFSSKTTLYKV